MGLFSSQSKLSVIPLILECYYTHMVSVISLTVSVTYTHLSLSVSSLTVRVSVLTLIFFECKEGTFPRVWESDKRFLAAKKEIFNMF